MMSLKDDDCKGYVRAGHIFKKMRRFDAAKTVYAHGLKFVKDISGRKTLEKCQSELEEARKAFAPDTTRDPLAVLPYELVLHCLQGFTLPEVTVLLSVCKSWNKTLIDMPELWRIIDCTSATAAKRVTQSFIKACAAKSNYTATEVHLRHLGNRGATETLPWLLEKCKQLVTIDIGQARPQCISAMIPQIFQAEKLRKLVVDCRLPYSLFLNLAKGCKQLRHAEFHNVDISLDYIESSDIPNPNLEHFVLALESSRCTYAHSWHSLARWIGHLTKLKHLTLINTPVDPKTCRRAFKGMTQLKTLTLCGVPMFLLPQLPPSLEKISFIKCSMRPKVPSQMPHIIYGEEPISSTEDVVATLPNLRSLNLLENTHFPPTMNHFLSTSLAPYQHLSDLFLIKETSMKLPTNLEELAPNLERLSIYGSATVAGPKICTMAVKSWPRLYDLDLSHTDITSRDVLLLLAACESTSSSAGSSSISEIGANASMPKLKLRKLALGGRTDWIDRSVIDKALAMGISIDTCTYTFNVKGERTKYSVRKSTMISYYG
jgi:hypothetical protein